MRGYVRGCDYRAGDPPTEPPWWWQLEDCSDSQDCEQEEGDWEAEDEDDEGDWA